MIVIDDDIDRQTAKCIRKCFKRESRGIITVINSKVIYVEQSFVQVNLGGDIKPLIEELIKTYNPQKEYVLVCI
jgi:hypothetical protein